MGDSSTRDGRSPKTYLFVALLGALAALHAAGPRWVRAGDGFKFEWRLWTWYIEDAAISFAYARNLWQGDGLVANIGGERVEGYSNPLWVALMALHYPLGIDGFLSSKVMGLVFAALTTWLVWRIAERALPDDARSTALVAPIVIASSAQFAIWNASGLENPLFSFLLALGIYRALLEDAHALFPWSSLVWFAMALTRPEAILYAAWGGFWSMVFAWRSGRGLRPTLIWLALFFTPYTAYQAWRYDYFAWAFPNTYYAKLGERNIRIWNWGSGGWRYVRNWANELGAGYFFPAYVVGLLGTEGRRRWATAAIVLALAVVLGYPEQLGRLAVALGQAEGDAEKTFAAGETWMMVRFAVISVSMAGMGLATLGTPGWKAKVLVYGPALFTLMFAVRSGGDWMKGYRWMSFLAVPSAVLWACAVHELASWGQRAFSRSSLPAGEWSVAGWMTATTLTAMVIPPNLAHTAWFMGPRETSPQQVHDRVNYTASVQRRLFLDKARNFDVDMGAHMYWSTHEMVDIAGLIDVPMARHRFEMPFIREYVFNEKKPEFAHVHGGWASQSRVPQHAEWKRDYMEIPGYPAGKQLHPGNYIRRALVMDTRWSGPEGRRVTFDHGVTLEGWAVPSPEVSHAKSFFVEFGVSVEKPDQSTGLRILGFLSDEAGHLLTFDLPTGYDWLPPEKWRSHEVFHGRFAPLLPQELPPGTYELGFLLLSGDGAVVPARAAEGAVLGGVDGEPARLATGEVRFPGAVIIGEDGTAERHAESDLNDAVRLASEGRCEAAENAWMLARRHLPNAHSWHDEQRARVDVPFSDCWTAHAAAQDDQSVKVASFERALAWGPRHDPAWAAAEAYSATLYATGMAAREQGKWEAAYAAFRDAVRVLPTNAWARRYAEEARDERLGLQGDASEQPEPARKPSVERKAKPSRPARAPAAEEPGEPEPVEAEPAEEAP